MKNERKQAIKKASICMYQEEIADKLEELEFNNSPDVNFQTSSGQYHPDFTAAIWRLLDLRVSLDHLNPVVETCLSLVGKKMTNRPARSTLDNMSAARLAAAQAQIVEVNTR